METRSTRSSCSSVLLLVLLSVVSCTVPEEVEDAGPRLPSVCSTLRCSPWMRCVERPDAGCVDAVRSLRWLLPPADASVPLDTTRIAFELEVDGTITQVPIQSMSAAATVTYRLDGGRLSGWLDVGIRDAGVVILSAGWPGGPDASVVVQFSPVRSLEIVGPNPPTYGSNTDTFQPNDPDGPAWRRDDLVPIRPWPGSSVTARQARPGSVVTVADAGGSADGGSSLRLQDVEFNAFRDEVEVSATGSFWEAPSQRITVTRWRWQRVVGGVPRPLQIHQPRPADIWPGPLTGIVVGTRDTETTGTLVQFDAEGKPTSAFAGWTAAVTTPYVSEAAFVGGVDVDGGFVRLPSQWGVRRLDAPIVRAASFDDWMVGVTADGRLLFVWLDVSLVPGCNFDGGHVVKLVTGSFETFAISNLGQVCRKTYEQDAGPVSLRVRPSSFSGPGTFANVTASNGDAWAFKRDFYDAGLMPFPSGPANADYILREILGVERLIAATPSLLEVYESPRSSPRLITAQLVSSLPLAAPLAVSPVLRPNGNSGFLLAVDVGGTLRSFDTPVLRELWSWRPDGGVLPSAPLGFSPSQTRLGSLLIVVENRLLSVISDGTIRDPRFGDWSMEDGTVTGCHEACQREPTP